MVQVKFLYISESKNHVVKSVGDSICKILILSLAMCLRNRDDYFQLFNCFELFSS